MKKGKTFRQRGQATLEIAAALIAVVFLVTGFFTLGGIGITGIKSLLLTRHAAETAAADTTTGNSQSVRQLAGWSYARMELKTADGGRIEVQIPFLAGDEERWTNRSAAGDYLDNETASLSMSPERARHAGDADYRFLGYRQTPDNDAPQAVYSGDSADLAMLVLHAAEMPDGLGNEQNYLLARRGADRLRTGGSGWLSSRGIDLTKWPSSTFAFPAFGPRR